MPVSYRVGDKVSFAGADSVVRRSGRLGVDPAYLLANGPAGLPMWVPEAILAAHQRRGSTVPVFSRRLPHVLAVDDFFDDPDEIRALALAQSYSAAPKHYKGLRSDERFLWPHLREEMGRLLGTEVVEWLGHDANGVFQQTRHDDPLVWHHDTQGYAAAVYLTPDAPPGSGTSFWRDRAHGCRRRPSHPFERRRLGAEERVRAAEGVVYDKRNIEQPDGWELVEAVAGLYNRLVIWDASLLHSATSYEAFSPDGACPTRLVQLFFFDVAT